MERGRGGLCHVDPPSLPLSHQTAAKTQLGREYPGRFSRAVRPLLSLRRWGGGKSRKKRRRKYVRGYFLDKQGIVGGPCAPGPSVISFADISLSRHYLQTRCSLVGLHQPRRGLSVRGKTLSEGDTGINGEGSVGGCALTGKNPLRTTDPNPSGQ